MALLSLGAMSTQAESILAGARVRLPIAVISLGRYIVLYGVWGTLVLVFNPPYAPFVLQPKAAIRIATKGPYALVRHPRYAAEALLECHPLLVHGLLVPSARHHWLARDGSPSRGRRTIPRRRGSQGLRPVCRLHSSLRSTTDAQATWLRGKCTAPNHSLVPTRLPPQGERALASHLRGHRIEVVPATPRGTVRGR